MYYILLLSILIQNKIKRAAIMPDSDSKTAIELSLQWKNQNIK